MSILITGGAGYIGSHTCVELLATGYDLVVLDNLSNASVESLRRVSKICGVGLEFTFPLTHHVRGNDGACLTFVEGDIRDRGLLRSVFERFEIEAVIHFAGLKAVGESVAMPLHYYDNNVSGSVALFEVMAEFGCKRVVFSSSATVFGGDYDTVDGTGVRDYIHVVDLAKGHVAALRKLMQVPGLVTVNLGTGRGYSVLEMVKAFEKASGKSVPYEVVARRPGDVAQCYADPSYALNVLDWKAELGINRMCEDAWRWQSQNPRGFL